MAHVRHYTAPSVRDILKHNSRADNYSNPDIDSTRSHYNYSLSGHDDNYAYYEKRLSEVHHMKRANLNTLSSWVITLPKGIKHEDQQRFFLECVNFLNDRYGEKNVVSADVHFDETTPHLHYTFIPVVFDEKKKREKVSCKELFRLKELYSFHDDLEQHLTSRLGYQVGIKTGKTEKNVSIRELKNTTKAEIIAEAQKIADKCVTDANKEAANIKERAEEEKRKIEDSFAEKAAVVRKYEFSLKEFNEACDLEFKLQNKKGFFGYVSMRKELAMKLLANAGAAHAAHDAVLYADARANALQCNDIHVSAVENENRILKEQLDRQQKILEKHGLVKQPEWKRKLGKSKGKSI